MCDNTNLNIRPAKVGAWAERLNAATVTTSQKMQRLEQLVTLTCLSEAIYW